MLTKIVAKNRRPLIEMEMVYEPFETLLDSYLRQERDKFMAKATEIRQQALDEFRKTVKPAGTPSE